LAASRLPRIALAERAARAARRPDPDAVARVRADDRELLVHLYRWARWVSVDQAQRLSYPEYSLRYVENRLNEMRRAGILRAIRQIPSDPTEVTVLGGARLLYGIAKWGIWIVEREVLADGGRRRRESDFELTAPYLDHQLKLNDLAIGLTEKARGSGVEFDWLTHREALVQAGKQQILPDAVVEFYAGSLVPKATVVVELDRGTATHRRVREKLMRYSAVMLHARAHQADPGEDGARWARLSSSTLLWLCESETRRAWVRDALRDVSHMPRSLVTDLAGGARFLSDVVDRLSGGGSP
jgi:hypothetical protein